MTILSSTINILISRRFIYEKISSEFHIWMKNDILSLSTAFSPISLKKLIQIYELWLTNGITSTNIPLKAKYDIAWWYKCQIQIAVPTFTLYDFQKCMQK